MHGVRSKLISLALLAVAWGNSGCAAEWPPPRPAQLLPTTADATTPVSISVDPNTVVRENNRHFFGQNLAFPRVAEVWDDVNEAFESPFWKAFQESSPGMLRFPAGNWSYGYHFNLAREGVRHWINWQEDLAHGFRPQHFLKTINELNATGTEATPLIHSSPVFTSPEEATAWVAYMIGSPNDARIIGLDSWERVDPATGQTIDWKTVGYWASLRQNTDGVDAYRGRLFFQLGNEEYLKKCADRSCSTAKTDYYGVTREVRKSTIEEEGRPIPAVVKAYYPLWQAVFRKIRLFFDSSQVAVGAVAQARPSRIGANDAFFRTGDRWNERLFANMAADDLPADFVTIHTYMYAWMGWQDQDRHLGTHNIFAAHDGLRGRVHHIREQAPPTLRNIPIYITEFNTAHVRTGRGQYRGCGAPHQPICYCTSNCKCTHQNNCNWHVPPSSLLDALNIVNLVASAMYMPEIGGMVRWLTMRKSDHLNRAGALTLFAVEDDSDKLYKLSSFYAYKLLGNLYRKVVAITGNDSPRWMPSSQDPMWPQPGRAWWNPRPVPIVMAAATISEDDRGLAVLLLNKSTKSSYKVHLDLGSFEAESKYRRIELNTNEPDAGHDDLYDRNLYRNSRRGVPAVKEQTKIVTTESNASGPVILPPHSATLLRFTRKNP